MDLWMNCLNIKVQLFWEDHKSFIVLTFTKGQLISKAWDHFNWAHFCGLLRTSLLNSDSTTKKGKNILQCNNSHNKNGRVFSLFNVVRFPNDACSGKSNDYQGVCLTSSECSNKVNTYSSGVPDRLNILHLLIKVLWINLDFPQTKWIPNPHPFDWYGWTYHQT